MLIYAIIVTIILFLAVFAGLVGWKRYYGYIDFFNKQRNRYRYMLRVYDMWVDTEQKNLSMEDYLLKKNEKTIVIYGVDIMGIRIYAGLRNSKIDVKYGIQNKSEGIPVGLEIVNDMDGLDLNGAAVIVTDYFDYYDIEKKLKAHNSGNVYSLDEILTGMIMESQK